MPSSGMNPAVSAYRSLTRAASARNAKLPPGLVRRIARYAAPYRSQMVAYLGVTILDASLVVATPLLLR